MTRIKLVKKTFFAANRAMILVFLFAALIEHCLASSLGSKCQHDMDCTDFIKGSTCSMNGYCECAPYFVQYNVTTCLSSQLLGGDCILADQCKMKVSNSSCLDGACRCVEGFLQFRKHTCLGPAHPGAVCYSHAHCQMNDKRSHCDFLIPNLFGRCQCTSPAKQYGGICVGADANAIEGDASISQSTTTYTPMITPPSTVFRPIDLISHYESTTQGKPLVIAEEVILPSSTDNLVEVTKLPELAGSASNEHAGGEDMTADAETLDILIPISTSAPVELVQQEITSDDYPYKIENEDQPEEEATIDEEKVDQVEENQPEVPVKEAAVAADEVANETPKIESSILAEQEDHIDQETELEQQHIEQQVNADQQAEVEQSSIETVKEEEEEIVKKHPELADTSIIEPLLSTGNDNEAAVESEQSEVKDEQPLSAEEVQSGDSQTTLANPEEPHAELIVKPEKQEVEPSEVELPEDDVTNDEEKIQPEIALSLDVQLPQKNAEDKIVNVGLEEIIESKPLDEEESATVLTDSLQHIASSQESLEQNQQDEIPPQSTETLENVEPVTAEKEPASEEGNSAAQLEESHYRPSSDMHGQDEPSIIDEEAEAHIDMYEEMAAGNSQENKDGSLVQEESELGSGDTASPVIQDNEVVRVEEAHTSLIDEEGSADASANQQKVTLEGADTAELINGEENEEQVVSEMNLDQKLTNENEQQTSADPQLTQEENVEQAVQEANLEQVVQQIVDQVAQEYIVDENKEQITEEEEQDAAKPIEENQKEQQQTEFDNELEAQPESLEQASSDKEEPISSAVLEETENGASAGLLQPLVEQVTNEEKNQEHIPDKFFEEVPSISNKPQETEEDTLNELDRDQEGVEQPEHELEKPNEENPIVILQTEVEINNVVPKKEVLAPVHDQDFASEENKISEHNAELVPQQEESGLELVQEPVQEVVQDAPEEEVHENAQGLPQKPDQEISQEQDETIQDIVPHNEEPVSEIPQEASQEIIKEVFADVVPESGEVISPVTLEEILQAQSHEESHEEDVVLDAVQKPLDEEVQSQSQETATSLVPEASQEEAIKQTLAVTDNEKLQTGVQKETQNIVPNVDNEAAPEVATEDEKEALQEVVPEAEQELTQEASLVPTVPENEGEETLQDLLKGGSKKEPQVTEIIEEPILNMLSKPEEPPVPIILQELLQEELLPEVVQQTEVETAENTESPLSETNMLKKNEASKPNLQNNLNEAAIQENLLFESPESSATSLNEEESVEHAPIENESSDEAIQQTHDLDNIIEGAEPESTHVASDNNPLASADTVPSETLMAIKGEETLASDNKPILSEENVIAESNEKIESEPELGTSPEQKPIQEEDTVEKELPNIQEEEEKLEDELEIDPQLQETTVRSVVEQNASHEPLADVSTPVHPTFEMEATQSAPNADDKSSESMNDKTFANESQTGVNANESEPTEAVSSAVPDSEMLATPVAVESDYSEIEKFEQFEDHHLFDVPAEAEPVQVDEKLQEKVESELEKLITTTRPNYEESSNENVVKHDEDLQTPESIKFNENESVFSILSGLMEDGTEQDAITTALPESVIDDLKAEGTVNSEQTPADGLYYPTILSELLMGAHSEEVDTAEATTALSLSAAIEESSSQTIVPGELPFDLSFVSSNDREELMSDNLVVETTSESYLGSKNEDDVTTEVPNILEITTQTMLGLASRVTLMEPAAPVTTTLKPFMSVEVEEFSTTPSSHMSTDYFMTAKPEIRKRVELGNGPVSLGLRCSNDKQCQLADPYTVCNERGVCDCASKRTAEKQCSAERTGCSPGTFQCRSSGVCISWFFVCDGRPDCTDASDEECTFNARLNQTCPTESFRCEHSGSCISRAALCDGRKQCPHGEDEIECNSLKNEGGQCPPNTFRCNSGECLPEYEYCNAIISCKDGSDEPPHLCGSRSVPNIFLRLLTAAVVDGGSNSSGRSSNGGINAYCPHRCSNGRCRSTAIVCSGRDGCGDGTDEETCSACRCPAPAYISAPAEFLAQQPPMPLWK